jgi:hypothetical protein
MVLAASAAHAEPLLTQAGYATSPLKGFLIRYSNLFVLMRDAFIWLSAFAFIGYAWESITKGKLEFSGLSFLAASLIALMSLESVMLWLANPDKYDVSEAEEASMLGVLGRAYEEPPQLADVDYRYITDINPIDLYGSITLSGHSGLGELSRAWESGDRGSDAWNPDDPGGGSYGIWQISAGSWGDDSSTGTMRAFMSYIRAKSPEIYKELKDVGGAQGARNRNPAFLAAWRKIAAEQPEYFENLQFEFIRDTHFRPAVDLIEKNFPRIEHLTVNPVVEDVIWSMAVQHGPGDGPPIAIPVVRSLSITMSGTYGMVYKVLHGRADIDKMTAEEFIELLYAERANFVGGINIPNKQAILDRYPAEKQMALEMLKGLDTIEEAE